MYGVDRLSVKRALYRAATRLKLDRALAESTQSGLKILCYHNFSTGDEPGFRPELFMHPETLEERIHYLIEEGYHILTLRQAVRQLSAGHVIPKSVVFTFDDGWYGTYRYALPILNRHGIPYTIYVYSDFSETQEPVYPVLLSYMYFAGTGREEAVAYLSACCGETPPVPAGSRGRFEQLADRLLRTRTPSEQRIVARDLAGILGVSWEEIVASRRFHLMGGSEIEETAARGGDIQLHTHRHRWPSDRGSALREIRENRAYLEPLVGRRLTHFCYPGGSWSEEQLPFLREAGIDSAVTCEAGGNGPGSNPLVLKRFLDGQHISKAEFEAEVTGLSDALRRCRSLLHPAAPPSGAALGKAV